MGNCEKGSDGSSNSQQWDLRGQSLIFNYYCTGRVLGRFGGWTQEVFNRLGFVLQWCSDLVLVASLLFVVAAVALMKLTIQIFLGECQGYSNIYSRNDKMYSSQFPYLSLRNKAVF